MKRWKKNPPKIIKPAGPVDLDNADASDAVKPTETAPQTATTKTTTNSTKKNVNHQRKLENNGIITNGMFKRSQVVRKH